MIIDALVKAADAKWTVEKKWNAEIAKADGIIYCKPLTFMNDSGVAVAAVMNFYKIPIGNVVAVYDDKDLPFGIVRLRSNGSSAGHNGVKSLIEHVNTMQFARVRVGIAGENMQGETADYVLGKFSKEESSQLPGIIRAAVEGTQYILLYGITKESHRDVAIE
jgi:PTH1 family peptidyl-tRNA hydrolase